MPARFLALLLVLTVGGLAPAQGLVELAPDSAVLVLDMAPDAGPPAGLVDALAALGWADAAETLGRLAKVLSGEALEGMGGEADPLAEIVDACPAAADALDGLELDRFVREGLLLVSLSPFAPTPHGIALARVADEARAGALQDALVACFGGPRLEQDGVALEVLFDGGDMPLIVTRVADVFVIGTEPNLVRGVVRRAGGAAEPSLAGTPLGAALARLEPGGVGLGVDLAGLGAVARALAGAVPPEATDLLDRAIAALETLGVFAGRVGWTDGGLRFERIHVWPDAAPDAALGALLADPRRAERPVWIPAGAVAASATLVPLRGVIDYVDGWLAALEAPLGTRADLHGLAADLLDLDLDAALLSWIGETVQVIELEPYGTDLRAWIQGPARIVVIPVLNEDLARSGLPQLGEGGLRLLGLAAALADDPLGMGGDPFGDPFGDPYASGPAAGDDAFDALFGPQSVVTTRETVAGIEVDRVRVGPTLDLAVAIVDGHVVLATPFRALRPLLELRAGAADATVDPAWRGALSAWPREARDVGIIDAPAYLRALAELADALAQPLASTLALVASEGFLDGFGGPSADDWGSGWDDWDGGWDDGLTPPSSFGSLPYDLDLDALAATPLVIGDVVTGELSDDAPHARYALVGAGPAATVEVEMTDESGWLDTYLYVFDGETGELLFENDDAPGWDRSFVAFVAEPNVRYEILASSYGGMGVGAFRLAVRVRADDGVDPFAVEPEADPFAIDVDTVEPAEAVEPPTFAELLAAADLFPRTLELLAERSGIAITTSTLEGSSLVTRWVLPLR